MALFNAFFWKAAGIGAGSIIIGYAIILFVLYWLIDQRTPVRTVNFFIFLISVGLLILAGILASVSHPIDHWYEIMTATIGSTGIFYFIGFLLTLGIYDLSDEFEDSKWGVLCTMVVVPMILAGVTTGLLNVYLWVV